MFAEAAATLLLFSAFRFTSETYWQLSSSIPCSRRGGRQEQGRGQGDFPQLLFSAHPLVYLTFLRPQLEGGAFPIGFLSQAHRAIDAQADIMEILLYCNIRL